MPGSPSLIGVLSRVDPETARTQILSAAKRHKGSRAAMAKELSVSRETLWRCCKRLGITPADVKVAADG